MNRNLNERKFPWPVGHEPAKEEVEKYFEEVVGIPISFYWEDIGGGQKRGVLTPRKKSANDLEKALGNGQPVNFQIENPEGKLVEVSREEFARWTEEEKNVKTLPKESLVYGVKGNIDGLTYFTERKGQDEVIKESYHEVRSKEEKKQIIERNQKRRKQELEENKINLEQQIQNQENSPNSDKKDQQVEKETNQQNQSQKIDNKDNNSKNVYYGIGVISLALVAISMITVWVKREKKLK